MFEQYSELLLVVYSIIWFTKKLKIDYKVSICGFLYTNTDKNDKNAKSTYYTRSVDTILPPDKKKDKTTDQFTILIT